MRTKIIPAVIAANQAALDDLLARIAPYATLAQLDVMDGVFVKNKSLWFDFRLPRSRLKYEAHLMTKKPLEWIRNHGSKVDMMIFHFEATSDHHKIIKAIRKKKKQVGVALNPQTPIKKLVGIIDFVDQVTIMTVNPGAYGSAFLPDALAKVKELRKLCPNLDIEVDGGMDEKTIKRAKRAGANKFISGSYLLKQKSMKEGLRTLNRLIK